VSARAHTLPADPRLAEAAQNLLGELGWFGMAQLQFVLPAEGEPCLIDFNGRFYGSLALATASGTNLPAIWAAMATGRTPPTPRGPTLGLRYQWLEGDLQRAVVERRGGLARDLWSCLRYSRGAVHSIWSARDPGPARHYLATLPGRAVRRELRDRAERPGPPLVRSERRRAEVVSDRAGLSALEDRWRTLAEARGNAFLTPEWYFAWLRHYGEGARAEVIVSRRRDGSVRGLIPTTVRRSGPATVLRFAGANLGDYFHPVASPGDECEVGAAIVDGLGHRKRGWSAVVLDHVSMDGRWWKQIVEGDPAGLSSVAYREGVLPIVAIAGLTWEEYLATRSRNLRSQIRRKTGALERSHAVRFRLTREAAELDRDLDTFFRLHDLRWGAREGSSSLTERSRAFHGDFAAAALKRGWLRLWFLELDGNPVASWYGWRLGGRYSYYLAGFDPGWARHSVGFVLLAHTIRSAIEEGAQVYDLLLGDEQYKSRFATGGQRVHTVVVAPSRHLVRLLITADAAAWRVGRRLPDGVKDRLGPAFNAIVGRMPAGVRR
jgi:CelD/BcsL family acetyltransferase involved in cellulose biosynthesis